MTLDMFDHKFFPGFNLQPTDIPRALAPFTAGMPLERSRLAILTEVSQLRLFREEIYKPLRANLHVDTGLAAKMAYFFPVAFQDPFLKKAQLTLGLIAANFRARGFEMTTDLTAYADYRVPQVLRHLGVLEYAPALAAMIDSGKQIPSGSAEETAIRAATILACAKLAARKQMTDAEVDSWLFEKSRDTDFQKNAKPFHLTVTTHY